MKEATENQEASDLKYWKEVRIWFFRVLKWISLAMGIFLLITFWTYAENDSQRTTGFTCGSLFVLFAIFFRLEQQKP